MDTPDSTTIPTKRCGRGERCVSPGGPWLPATAEYFYRRTTSLDGFDSRCKNCVCDQKGTKRTPRLPPAPEGYRRCSECEEIFEATLDNFYADKTKRYGVGSTCISCRQIRDKEYVETHKEQVQTYQKGYRDTHREEANAYSRQWHKDHPGKQREYDERSHAKHPVRHNPEKHRRWRHKNPDKVRDATRRRRARKQAADGDYTDTDVKEQYQRQKGICYWCGSPLNPDDCQPDHVIPLSKGGDNTKWNIVTVHPGCNQSKKDKLPHEWKGSRGKLL